MKKRLLLPLAIAAGLFFNSCSKTNVNELSAPVEPVKASSAPVSSAIGSPNCAPTVVTLMAGQTIDAGNVTVWNDDINIYVTYNAANGYYLKETHLYVGNCSAIPVNNPGNPVPGQFPYSGYHNYITTYTYQVPRSAMGNSTCGCIAAHAALVKLGSTGNVIESQTGWGNGTRINLSGGNWGMKFEYCTCNGEIFAE